MPVYIIEAADSGRLKIGYTAGDPRKRLSALVTGTPERLRLVAVAPGDKRNERELHQHFATVRQHNEWFEPTDELRALIEAFGCEWLSPDRRVRAKREKRSGRAHDLIDDLKAIFGDETEEAFAARFVGRTGEPMTRPALRAWRSDGLPLKRVLQIAAMLKASGKRWPQSFLDLYKARVPVGRPAAISDAA